MWGSNSIDVVVRDLTREYSWTSFPGIPQGGLWDYRTTYTLDYVVDRGSWWWWWWCFPSCSSKQQSLRWMELLQKVECHVARTRPSSFKLPAWPGGCLLSVLAFSETDSRHVLMVRAHCSAGGGQVGRRLKENDAVKVLAACTFPC